MSESGMSVLAKAFSDRVKQLNDEPPIIDLCTIQSDLSLKLDVYELVIPKGDYIVLVNHKACTGFAGCSGSENCSGFRGCSGHKNWSPEAGDRCVVAWLGNDPIILGKIG